MRKLHLFLLLAGLLPLCFACESYVEPEPSFNDPAYARYAARLDLSDEAVSTKAAARPMAAPGGIVSIDLTESGLYAIGRLQAGTDTIKYTAGTYTVSGDTYQLNGYGSLSFDNSTSGAVNVTLTPRGGRAQECEAVLQKATGDKDFVLRGWNVDKTRVTVRGWRTVSADFQGCSFPEIAEFLRNNGHKAPSDVPNHSVNSISFTGTDEMIVIYSDGTADVSSYSLSGNVVNYVGSNINFTFETDAAVIDYMDGKCILTFDGRIRNSTTSGSVTFVLSSID